MTGTDSTVWLHLGANWGTVVSFVLVDPKHKTEISKFQACRTMARAI